MIRPRFYLSLRKKGQKTKNIFEKMQNVPLLFSGALDN